MVDRDSTVVHPVAGTLKRRRNRMFTVIAFDVSSNRRRYRVVRLLKKYSVRVQKSVFEAPRLGTADLIRLRQQLDRLIDPRTDTVRYYPVCSACVDRVVLSGPGGVTPNEEFKVV